MRHRRARDMSNSPPRLSRTGRRSQSRLRVRLPARLTTVSEIQNAMLLDLNMYGAKLALNHPVKIGAEAVVEWSEFEAFGLVNWVRGSQCGLEFIDPIPAKVLIATRDIDDVEHVHRDSDLVRKVARSFVSGGPKG